MISFYVDESSLISHFDDLGTSSTALKAMLCVLEDLLLIECCTLWLPPKFYELQVGALTVVEHVFSDSDPEHRDTIRRLQQIIDRSNSIEGPSPSPPDIGWQSLQREGRGGIVSSSDLEATAWWCPQTMDVLDKPAQLPKSLRKLLPAYKAQESDVIDLSDVLFPSIYFHVYPTMKKLGLSYHENADIVMQHLSWLNDQASSAFATLEVLAPTEN